MTYKKIPYQTISQVLPRFKASDEAKQLLANELPIADGLQALSRHKLNSDLVQLLAHCLPVREAILWGALCLETRNDVWSPLQKQTLETCKQWVLSPSEELRRKAELLANRLELNCGPSWLAQAVFWNGSGSIIAPDQPPVMPDPFLYAKATAGAINHAAALPDWKKNQEFIDHAYQQAINIAQGGQGIQQVQGVAS